MMKRGNKLCGKIFNLRRIGLLKTVNIFLIFGFITREKDNLKITYV